VAAAADKPKAARAKKAKAERGSSVETPAQEEADDGAGS
jgi:hypothetical protein